MIHVTPYEMPVRINSYQTDSRSRLSLYNLFQLFQEAAYRHAEELGWGWDYLQTQNQFWALTRVVMEIDRMPLWNEELTLRTAPRLGESVMAPRDLLLIDKDGKVCVKCTSFWIIMDIEKRTPVLAEKFFGDFDFDPACDLCSLSFRKIRGQFEESPLYSREVFYSSLDMNGHVNNASYIRFLSDALSREQHENNRLTSFQIVFQKEAHMGDRLDIYRGADKEGNAIFKASCEEGDVVTARIGYAGE
ncbi:MAG: thioesterase [Spirochaetales bacterium]|nr:thioesterase [Spirochaetales bacterium]